MIKIKSFEIFRDLLRSKLTHIDTDIEPTVSQSFIIFSSGFISHKLKISFRTFNISEIILKN